MLQQCAGAHQQPGPESTGATTAPRSPWHSMARQHTEAAQQSHDVAQGSQPAVGLGEVQGWV
jgi:hypothetical protein